MIPSYLSLDVKSSGEKRIFQEFAQDQNSKSWVVLHSLNLAKHTRRLYGEIDFLVLAPNLGIFCLEVKSGRIKRTDGVWKYINRFGETDNSTRGPFQQAREGMFSLKEALRKKFGDKSHVNYLLMGFGVMFPDIVFEDSDIEMEKWQIYDSDDRRRPISNYIKQLSDKHKEKLKNTRWFDEQRSLPSSGDIDRILNFLRGNFELFPSIRRIIDDTETQIRSLTQEQTKCLEQLDGNNGCLFQGPAGTGKTLIAIESARRAVIGGKRVLLTCYNTLLGSWLQSQFNEYSNDGNLVVGSFLGYLMKICEINNDELDASNKDEFFKYELPRKALEVLNSGKIELFDKVIIDEGQDLIRIEYLDVINALLKNGLEKGNWEIYSDFEKQAIFTDVSASDMIKTLEQRASFTKFKLSINCRNTKPVGEEISMVCGISPSNYLQNNFEGPPVEYFFYKSQNDEKDNLRILIEKLAHSGIPLEKITILSPKKYANSIINDSNSIGLEFYELNKNNLLRGPKDKISFSTIHGFKGLENSYIIITDIEQIESQEFSHLLYVGMSRARVGLFLFINQTTESSFNKIIGESIKNFIEP